jgi:hypothetical protein
MSNNLLHSKNHNFNEDEKPLMIESLYPDLTPEQQREAEYFFTRYVKVVRRIFERSNND